MPTSLADDICDWAEREIVVPTSEATSGALTLAPYQREILRAFADPDVRQVTLMAASQTGKTLMLMVMLGFAMTHDPRQMLMASPRLEDTKKFVRTKFTPLHAESAALRAVTRREMGQRYGGWSFSRIEFAGGALTFANAGSPASLRQTTARYLFADEVDAYPMGSVDAENPLDQIRQRGATFGARSKMVVASTPIHEDLTLIGQEWADGSMGEFQLRCLACRKWLTLGDDNVVDGEREALVCDKCGVLFGESDRRRMIDDGRWSHADPGNSRKSFHLSQLCSPFVPLSQTLAERRRGPVWWSHAILARPYSGGETAKIEPEQAAGLWRDKSPLANIDCVTVGVDVQANRLEATVVEWEQATAHVTDHRIIAYAKDQPRDLARAFETLADVLESVRVKRLPLAVMVDGGYLTPLVHDGVKRMRARRALGPNLFVGKGYASKVRGSFGMELVAESKVRTHDFPSYTLAPDEAKLLAYQMALSDTPLLTVSRAVGPEWLEQFRSERLVETVERGVVRKRWVKRRQRNEGLDCFVLALCAHRTIESARMTALRRTLLK